MYEAIYAELRETDRLPLEIPLYSSDVHFAKVALEEKFGRPFDIQEVEDLLVEELNLPRNLQSVVGMQKRRSRRGA